MRNQFDPIRKANDDRLNRTDFASRLIKSLTAESGIESSGVVIGLVGPWGSGKSSVLNLMGEALSKAAQESDQTRAEPVLVRFEPWMVSGREDLIQAFFQELRDALPYEASAARSKVLAIAQASAPKVRSLLPALNMIPGFQAIAEPLTAALEGMGQTTLRKQKEELSEALRALRRPVIAFIDDIDRLTDGEIAEIVQLVRSVADLPSISYVLAYDQERVAEALGAGSYGSVEERRSRGLAAIEKVVNLEVYLPVLQRADASRWLADGLQRWRVTERADPTLMDDERGNALIRLLLDTFVFTPRDLARVLGAFEVVAPLLNEEIDLEIFYYLQHFG